jgi:type VI secretion system protein ImpK
VIGHTDNTPITGGNIRFPSNYALSVERAKSVATLFRPRLAKADRLQTEGKGETVPIADNRQPKGKKPPRRIDCSPIRPSP